MLLNPSYSNAKASRCCGWLPNVSQNDEYMTNAADRSKVFEPDCKPHPNAINLIGKRYGMLLVEARHSRNKHGHVLWVCKCDCGVEKLITTGGLYRRRSCGCQTSALLHQINRTHGMSGTREHNTWLAIKSRVFCESDSGYANYGARGITMCDGWSTKFTRFFKDMGIKPKGLTIDRINSNGHYSCGKCEQCRREGWPANCRWATAVEQCSNRRSNIIMEFKGRKQTMTQWAQELGVPVARIQQRIIKLGWTDEDALTKPVHYRHPVKA